MTATGEPDFTPPIPPPLPVVLRHEDVIEAAMASRSRLHGQDWVAPLLLLGLLAVAIWAGHLAAFGFLQQLPFAAMFAVGPYLPIVVPALFSLVAVWIGLAVQQRRGERIYLRNLALAGSPLVHSGVYEITTDALVLTTERMVLAPRWSAIDTVERGRVGWVISADQLHFLLPFAAFDSDAAQREMVAAIVSRLTAESRARSNEAVAYAAALPVIDDTDPSAPQPIDALPATIGAASGLLTIDEAGWAAGVMQQSISNCRFHAWAYPFTAAVAGAAVASVACWLIALFIGTGPEGRVSWLWLTLCIVAPLLGGALGLAFGNRRLALVVDEAWRAGLAARGVPQQFAAEWSLTETGLAYRTARFQGEAAFGSVHQVLHSHDRWIVGVDTLTLCIPETAFPSPPESQAFIAELLRRIPDDARECSVSIA